MLLSTILETSEIYNVSQSCSQNVEKATQGDNTGSYWVKPKSVSYLHGVLLQCS